jgi:hypothetical protein
MGKSNYTRGAKGRFTGSTGGRSGGGGFAKAQGAQTPGGLRGIKARSRLGSALRRQREIRKEAATLRAEQGASRGGKADRGYSKGRADILRRLKAARRAIATHKKEVVRIERRGLQRVGLLGRLQAAQRLKLSRGELLGIRQDRVYFAAAKLSRLRDRARQQRMTEGTREKSKNVDTGIASRRRSLARQLVGARKALRNRKRELKRLEG